MKKNKWKSVFFLLKMHHTKYIAVSTFNPLAASMGVVSIPQCQLSVFLFLFNLKKIKNRQKMMMTTMSSYRRYQLLCISGAMEYNYHGSEWMYLYDPQNKQIRKRIFLKNIPNTAVDSITVQWTDLHQMIHQKSNTTVKVFFLKKEGYSGESRIYMYIQ